MSLILGKCLPKRVTSKAKGLLFLQAFFTSLECNYQKKVRLSMGGQTQYHVNEYTNGD